MADAEPRARTLFVSLGDEQGHALAILRAGLEEPHRVALALEPGSAPRLEDGERVERDPVAIARALDPSCLPDDDAHHAWRTAVADTLIGGARALAHQNDQAADEEAYAGWTRELEAVEAHLGPRRFLTGDTPRLADVLLFCFAVRLDAVYFRLYEANPYRLEDLPALYGFARDLYERPAFHQTVDWDALVREPTEAHPILAPRAIVALGGRPDQRLFPTLFRHDAVYSSHLRLNAARVRDFPRLADWLARMRAWPGVSEASDLDRARNGYFGRSSNEIVPAGPTPLGLSPKDHPRAVWLDEPSESP
jgi:glutathionyl-hydroquinone reductase